MLSGVLELVWRSDHAEAFDRSGHRNRSRYLGTSALSGLDDLPRPKIQDAMIERLEDDSYFLFGCRQSYNP